MPMFNSCYALEPIAPCDFLPVRLRLVSNYVLIKNFNYCTERHRLPPHYLVHMFTERGFGRILEFCAWQIHHGYIPHTHCQDHHSTPQ
ncbi:hypothetical protein EXN66_Car012055 [Channa argus]|uniref:Uncharacterized protein n=1 Tax=Channa argus TaxID=215402 RepID=A0A6G1Q291_CHAAH|nr:hypothetical protein EXN66_Car012055 [Channa argus]